jgi:hypothetical protein
MISTTCSRRYVVHKAWIDGRSLPAWSANSDKFLAGLDGRLWHRATCCIAVRLRSQTGSTGHGWTCGLPGPVAIETRQSKVGIPKKGLHRPRVSVIIPNLTAAGSHPDCRAVLMQIVALQVRPLLQFDAPKRWLGGEEKSGTLLSRQATRHLYFSMRHQCLGVSKDCPQPCRPVRRRGDDALAVRAERRAQHSIRMAGERLADRLAGRGVPQPCCRVRRRSDDALAVGGPPARAHIHPASGVWPAGDPQGRSLPVLAPQRRAWFQPKSWFA